MLNFSSTVSYLIRSNSEKKRKVKANKALDTSRKQGTRKAGLDYDKV